MRVGHVCLTSGVLQTTVPFFLGLCQKVLLLFLYQPVFPLARLFAAVILLTKCNLTSISPYSYIYLRLPVDLWSHRRNTTLQHDDRLYRGRKQVVRSTVGVQLTHRRNRFHNPPSSRKGASCATHRLRVNLHTMSVAPRVVLEARPTRHRSTACRKRRQPARRSADILTKATAATPVVR